MAERGAQVAQRGAEGDVAGSNKLPRRFGAAAEREADHVAKSPAELSAREGMVGMVAQTGIVDRFDDLGPLDETFRDRRGVLAGPLGPQSQRAQPSGRQPAIKR